MSVKEIEVPLLDVIVYLINSKEDADRLVREVSGGEGSLERCVGCSHVEEDKDGRKHRMLCVFDGSRNTAVHESVHMARIILEHCSIQWSAKNDEPLAYLAGWLSEQVLDYLASPDA